MIIDIHSHLGDILEPGGGALIARAALPYPKGGVLATDDWFCYRRTPLSRLLAKFAGARIIAEERARNAAATLQNASASLDELEELDRRRGGDGRVVSFVMPIAPYVRYADLLPALAAEPRLKAFGCPDFSLPTQDMADDLAAQSACSGIKFHPILQQVRWDDPAFLCALEAWAAAAPGRPVLAHTGLSSYYPPNQRHRERPEYSDPAAAKKAMAAFPHIPFILGHGGLTERRAWAQACGGLDNVFAEGSFQGPAQLRELAALYGQHRLLFGSDWPYGRRDTAFRAARAAFSGENLERFLWKNASALLGV